MWDNDNKDELSNSDITRLTTQLISAYASRNALEPSDLLRLIDVVREKLGSTAVPAPAKPLQIEAETPATPSNPKLIREPNNPAVDPKKSVHRDYIICLEDGERVKMLKRYIKTHYDLEPAEYIKRWGLPSDYPFVCKKLSEARSETAKRVRPSDSKKKPDVVVTSVKSEVIQEQKPRFRRVPKAVPSETKVSGPASMPGQ